MVAMQDEILLLHLAVQNLIIPNVPIVGPLLLGVLHGIDGHPLVRPSPERLRGKGADLEVKPCAADDVWHAAPGVERGALGPRQMALPYRLLQALDLELVVVGPHGVVDDEETARRAARGGARWQAGDWKPEAPRPLAVGVHARRPGSAGPHGLEEPRQALRDRRGGQPAQARRIVPGAVQHHLAKPLLDEQCRLLKHRVRVVLVVVGPAEKRGDLQGRPRPFTVGEMPRGGSCEEDHEAKHATEARIALLLKPGSLQQYFPTHVEANHTIIRSLPAEVVL
mmetsp:Transcript_104153/g.331147  ORF Transcript_104153/g.331147 Transcript_104153/m.331147 type:complete len:281 (-) Transcript_104153:540-1382(-)